MTPELGQIALILALLLSLAQGVLPLIGAWRGNTALMGIARPAAVGQAVFVWMAFGLLAWSLLSLDFSVGYVAANANIALPWYYRFAAVWGAHEGSLLLWIAILATWTVLLAALSRHLPQHFAARVLAVLGLISVGFLAFILLTSNPFGRLSPIPLDGNELNPVLQDPGMTFHPPVLYTGYVGFSVAFAFAVAALLGGELEQAWVRWARPWTNVAWACLTAGIVAGSWWAYAELGWGGWWFWDPVENASFMPWLVGTALLHTQAVTEKRGSLRAWTILLSILAFSLSLLGTFLVRSGVLTSVHAFAADPRRGLYILIFLVAVVGGSLLLYALRAPKIASGKPFAAASRETGILIGNLLLTVAAAMVLLGTLFPLIADAFGLGKVSVGPPYFGLLFPLLMLPVVLLLPFGPYLRWGKAEAAPLKALGTRAGIAAIACALVGSVVADGQAKAIAGIGVAAWVAAGTALYVVKRWRDMPRGRRFPAEMAGMLIAHAGVAVFVAGVLVSESLSVERDVRLSPGESAQIAGYRFRFDGVQLVDGPNWKAEQGGVQVSRDGQVVAQLHPQKRLYSSERIQTESAIDPGVTRDLYVALGEPLDDQHIENDWTLRLYYKPFIRWIWAGGLLMMLGGFVSACARRFRTPATAITSAASAAHPAVVIAQESLP
ncbi:TPA: heme lyase CcmF/NrfE family subunit [Xanthomonas vasicola pv. zeae]|uniref:Heme lyase CcmF/NrfE family subunit n=6 Tax=Xanthomonas vasicola TaxID=56459 RepID=A0AAE8F5G6_XANVA|nr:heme lyase CcmF/NrfE family subunit [Xanthomonas vasicola]AVQ06728.1 heme lyase CcmF/NrfE family subunit [Xanthomonas vasicola pv. vasculorum]AZM70930.1 heme lyase CcmF/NrfE family subunit [Xanthomonas vasicola pv. vasculorum]AZR26841.1 heme lyase CcmF/NrfE family subunit [Xanthomonas vasicola pv. arecae]AZR31374.1 heme lyase CcmF/NrfE family subunit [Xanthomonas vasicola pv. musacearum NCPPB 4379]KFA12924.1 cytochrome C biogenesis protein [Xanthomonas vasicola pv. musacearum NCPPB 4380]